MNNIKFRRLGTMLDCSRGAVMTVGAVKKWIDIISDLGYNTLMLYTEDTYEVEGHPYFGYLRGRYSPDEIKAIDSYANKKGVELIPCIQTLAHLEAIFRWPQYREIKDCNDILLSKNVKTYELIDAMFKTLSKCFTSRIVNIGMDEAFMLGRGKYQDVYGYKDRFQILLEHLLKVSEIARKYDFEIIMWGDMFFRLLGEDYETSSNKMPPAEITALIPDNVNLVYWDYYSKNYENYNDKIKKHQAIRENIWFAGGLWSWIGYAPHNQFSIEATKSAFNACVDNGVKDVFLTMWGDDGAECSRFALLPSLFYASEMANGNSDERLIKENFKQKFGIAFDDFMLLDLPDTPNETNEGIINPDLYMFYNDCFLGWLDSTVTMGESKGYAGCAEKLADFVEHKEFGYLFSNLKNLCEVLSLKYELGLKTRAAYSSGNKDALKGLIEEYDKVIELVEKFYDSFRKQWFAENKPNGFEMHDIRIGGVVQRIKHCKIRLQAYINSEIDTLEELDESLLDAMGNGFELSSKPTLIKLWSLTSMIDVTNNCF